MPEPYWPKHKHAYTLSMANRNLTLVRVRCNYCKRTIHYSPADLIVIFGDIEVDDLMDRMKCEGGKHGRLVVDCVSPSAAEAQGIKLRRLAAIKIQKMPIWREE